MERTETALLSILGWMREPIVALVFCSVLALAFVQPAAAHDTNMASEGLTAMSFNLRVDGIDRPEHAWSVRHESAAQAIRAYAPDVVGTQEGTYPMLMELMDHLPEYDWVGVGRGGGLAGEFMAVLYRTDRLQVVAADHFWLSETPDLPGSRLSGVSNQRMVTWVRFRVRSSGAEFLLYNTHLDHQSQYAREFGARMIFDHVDRMTRLLGIPAIVTGDMNANPANPAIDLLMGPKDSRLLHDAGEWLRARDGSVGATFHGYAGTVYGEPIDYVFHTAGLQLQEFGVVRDRFFGRYPSDHYPVWARFAPLGEVVTFEQFQGYFGPELQSGLMMLLSSAGYSTDQATELLLQVQRSFPTIIASVQSRVQQMSPQDLMEMDPFSLVEPELKAWIELPESHWAQIRTMLAPFLRQVIQSLM